MLNTVKIYKFVKRFQSFIFRKFKFLQFCKTKYFRVRKKIDDWFMKKCNTLKNKSKRETFWKTFWKKSFPKKKFFSASFFFSFPARMPLIKIHFKCKSTFMRTNLILNVLTLIQIWNQSFCIYIFPFHSLIDFYLIWGG